MILDIVATLFDFEREVGCVIRLAERNVRAIAESHDTTDTPRP